MQQNHWDILSQWNQIRWCNMQQSFYVPRREYIAVLQNEVETLKRYYYKPMEEGTGHFNTTISVLEQRINELNTVPSARDANDAT